MPLTSTGFERPIQSELEEDITADQRGTISAQLDVSESTVIGNLNAIFADRLALAYELLEEAYSGHDPENATEDRLVAISLLTGTVRRPAQKGSVTIACTLAASTTFAAEALVVHAEDDPTNRWLNRDAVTTTTAGDYDVVFLSESAGAEFTAAADTLNVIASPLDGFSAATNDEDATPGRDLESVEELRIRREAELALGGSTTVDAIRAEVLQVEGVIEVLVEENTTDDTVDGITPHSIRVVVWDGDPGQAPNNSIAQAIVPAAGIATVGDLSGTHVRADGSLTTRRFDRAEVVDIYISANIVSATGVAAEDVKAALIAALNGAVGADVIYYKMSAAVFIDGVDDFLSFTLGTAPAPVGVVNIPITSRQIAQLDAGNIVLTGGVS